MSIYEWINISHCLHSNILQITLAASSDTHCAAPHQALEIKVWSAPQSHTHKKSMEHMRLEFTVCALINLQYNFICSSCNVMSFFSTRHISRACLKTLRGGKGDFHHQAWLYIHHFPCSTQPLWTPATPKIKYTNRKSFSYKTPDEPTKSKIRASLNFVCVILALCVDIWTLAPSRHKVTSFTWIETS